MSVATIRSLKQSASVNAAPVAQVAAQATAAVLSEPTTEWAARSTLRRTPSIDPDLLAKSRDLHKKFMLPMSEVFEPLPENPVS